MESPRIRYVVPFASPALTEHIIDGGGVRGLASLLILKRLMYRLKPSDDEYKLPKPCDVFDFIVGTSTGGLIAIMLGRLVRFSKEYIRAILILEIENGCPIVH